MKVYAVVQDWHFGGVHVEKVCSDRKSAEEYAKENYIAEFPITIEEYEVPILLWFIEQPGTSRPYCTPSPYRVHELKRNYGDDFAIIGEVEL